MDFQKDSSHSCCHGMQSTRVNQPFLPPFTAVFVAVPDMSSAFPPFPSLPIMISTSKIRQVLYNLSAHSTQPPLRPISYLPSHLPSTSTVISWVFRNSHVHHACPVRVCRMLRSRHSFGSSWLVSAQAFRQRSGAFRRVYYWS